MAEYQDFIRSSLSTVSTIAASNFGHSSSSVKTGDNNQVLTETDLAVGKKLIELIEAKYPGYNIIDEEAGVIDKKSDYTWVIDPIDGTSNFANGIPTYGILLGLLKGSEPIAGGLALPSFGEIFSAERGFGTYRDDKRVHVTDDTKLSNALVAYGIDGHQENPEITTKEMDLLGKIVLAIRNLRTSNSAYDMALLAEGKYGASLNRSSKIWDNVAQHIIIEEAGGKYTDYEGKPMDYSNPLSRADQNFTWCAGAPELHAQLQSIIHA